MENDLISRQKLIDDLEAWRKRLDRRVSRFDDMVIHALPAFFDLVNEQETVEAEPVRHGRWEWYEEERNSMFPDGDYGWRCSNCKQDLEAELALGIHGMHYAYEILDDPDHPPTLKRCLFCGAKMDAKEDDHD